jgi:formylmethanofuran dehydrogenase subunit E
MGYGKFAATFVNTETGEAYRVVDMGANKKNNETNKSDEETIEELTQRIARTPGNDLFKVQKVAVKIDKNDLPGKPIEIATCVECNEVIMDGKHHLKGGRAYCDSCFKGSYYELLEK